MEGPAEAPGLPGPSPWATRRSRGGSGLGPSVPGLSPHLSLSLLVYEMGVLARRIRCSIRCSARGTSLLGRSDHLWSCSSREGQRRRMSGAHSCSLCEGRPSLPILISKSYKGAWVRQLYYWNANKRGKGAAKSFPSSLTSFLFFLF